MTYSMTAYASRRVAFSNGTGQWEIRSVNHRYLELSFKLPEELRDLEYRLRELIRETLNRGKVECYLKLNLQEREALDIDFEVIKQLAVTNQKISEQFPLLSTVSLFDVLKWPSVIRSNDKDLSQLHQGLLDSFKLLLQDFLEARAREGLKLRDCIQERLVKMQQRVNKIRHQLPKSQNLYRTKFHEKLAELKLQFNKERFEEEMVYLIQKIDISEEIDRLETHLMEAKRVLVEEKIMGRRLDFLMQELNREANTLVSKAVDDVTVQDSIELKVFIEEIREQVQNLE